MGLSFFVLTKTSATGVVKGVCECGVEPETEKSNLEQKRLSQYQGLNIEILFQANSHSRQI